MTRAERKEAARLRCEERVNGYLLRIRKYVDRMNPTLENGISEVRSYAVEEIEKTPQMKDEIERCQCQAVTKFVEEFVGKLESEELRNKLNEYQIEHWRKVLLLMGFGPYALIMPAEDIQWFRDNLQRHLDREARRDEQKVFGFLE